MLWDDDEVITWAPQTSSSLGLVVSGDPEEGEVSARLPLREACYDDLTPGPPQERLMLCDRRRGGRKGASSSHYADPAEVGAEACCRPQQPEDIDTLCGGFVDTGKEFLATKAFLGAIYPPSVYRRKNEDGTPRDPFDNMDETFNNWGEPEIELELDYVMGYRARNSRYNIHWIDDDECVFPVAAVGVIYNTRIKDEDFFFEHNDDIISLDLHHANPDKEGDVDLVASGSLGAGRECQLCIWEARAPRRLRHNITGFLQFAVLAVNFNPDASLVCAVGFDAHHTVALFSVETGLLMGHCAADKNRLLHIRFNLSATVNSSEEFVTVGNRHVCFWTAAGSAGKSGNYYLATSDALDRRMIWNRGTGIEDIDHIVLTSLEFSYAHTIVGGSDGIIYLLDSIKHLLAIRIAVNTSGPAYIYSILALRGPRSDAEDPNHECIAVGTGRGLISFWDVNTDPSTKDVRIAENRTTTGDGSRINLNKLDDKTDNDSEALVNAVRSMAWYEPTQTLAVGTILTTVYAISIAKWTKDFDAADLVGSVTAVHQERHDEDKEGERTAPPEDNAVARVLVSGHYVGGNLTDETTGEVWGVDVHPSRHVCVTCGDDATVRLWDLDTAKQIALANVKYQSYMVAFHPSGKVVAVGHRNGGFTVLSGDLTTVVIPFQRLPGHTRCVCDLAFSPNGKFLAIAWAQSIDIFAFTREKDPVTGHTSCRVDLVGVCKGHTSFIDNFDWNLESTLLQSVSRGYDLLYHSIPDCVMVTGAKAIADELWFTQTCSIGWGVQGIWPRYADGTDINSTAKSRSQRWVASTDDWGRVKVFNYPCLGSGFDRKTGRLNTRPAYKDYRGHSSHVTNSAWTFDDSYLVTTGGADLSLFVWKVRYDAIPEEKRPKFFLNAASVGFVKYGKKGLAQCTAEDEPDGSRPGTGGSAFSAQFSHVDRSDGECFMCKYKYKPTELAETCPRCSAPRTAVPKGKLRKAWQGEASSRFTLPTQSFAKYTREQQAMRKETEERPKPEIHWKSGSLKVVETVHGASSDEEEIERKLQGKKKAALKAASAAANVDTSSASSGKSAAKPKAKKTSGPDFRDY